ncbi:17662_t:CDS:1, partial [Funneliformis geosporum]
IDALNDDMVNAENFKDKDQASQLVSNLDPEFIISTIFLADLMYILSKMIKIFQCDHIDLSELKHSLEITISAINAQFIGTEE